MVADSEPNDQRVQRSQAKDSASLSTSSDGNSRSEAEKTCYSAVSWTLSKH